MSKKVIEGWICRSPETLFYEDKDCGEYATQENVCTRCSSVCLDPKTRCKGCRRVRITIEELKKEKK